MATTTHNGTGAGRSPRWHATTHDQAEPLTSTSVPLSDDAPHEQIDLVAWREDMTIRIVGIVKEIHTATTTHDEPVWVAHHTGMRPHTTKQGHPQAHQCPWVTMHHQIRSSE